MKEREWVKNIVVERLQYTLDELTRELKVVESHKLPYTFEVRSYNNDVVFETSNFEAYETDLLILERLSQERWIPRVVIECKINTVTTHDAITYSHKASTHKNVHPYLRYGILLGHRKHYPLPGRLFRHGAHFDFMMSWRDYVPSDVEWNEFVNVINEEINASRTLESIIYNSRSPRRERYHCLHRKLQLTSFDD